MSYSELPTTEENFCAVSQGLTDAARIPVEIRTNVTDPFVAYKSARDEVGGVYLETTGGQEGWGYFATDPERWLRIEADDEVASLDALEASLADERLRRGDCDVPYPCGAFGWLSYDIARELEDLPDTTSDHRQLPRLQFGIYDRVAAWQEPRTGDSTELRITCCPVVEPEDDFRKQYSAARSRAEGLVREIREGDPEPESPPSDTDTMQFRNEVGQQEYADRVRRTKEYIRDGDTFQANISQRLVAPAGAHPTTVFNALRDVNPAPYSGLMELPGVDLVSTSPELLLRCNQDQLITEPIAGTRPRGANSAEDRELERELLDSEKEHAEHAMLVDLERNDLGKVCEYGSVDVTDYRRIDRYSEVMHTVSVVEGQRRDDASLTDAIAAVFPGGTITGAPKPRTMEIIDEIESTRRGPYTGSIGVIGFDEQAALNMTIRTLVQRDGTYYLRVGAGIVHDSEPEREFVETLDKGRALINAVDDAMQDQSEASLNVDTGRTR